MWKPIDTAPKEGIVLVYLEKPMLGSYVQPARLGPGMKTIGSLFHFDAPKPTHWMPQPLPPETEE